MWLSPQSMQGFCLPACHQLAEPHTAPALRRALRTETRTPRRSGRCARAAASRAACPPPRRSRSRLAAAAAAPTPTRMRWAACLPAAAARMPRTLSGRGLPPLAAPVSRQRHPMAATWRPRRRRRRWTPAMLQSPCHTRYEVSANEHQSWVSGCAGGISGQKGRGRWTASTYRRNAAPAQLCL